MPSFQSKTPPIPFSNLRRRAISADLTSREVHPSEDVQPRRANFRLGSQRNLGEAPVQPQQDSFEFSVVK